ncbi:GtrA family protein [Neobacillus niacini]|uniref:GtrA family protein n=1 Tax=Neobacillus niacini TaxID=86668 RepID=UPI00300087E7
MNVGKYGQFIKFCLVGAVNTSISLVVYAFLLKLNVYYLTASTIAYIAGILNGYIFSLSFVFKKKFNFTQGLKFVGVYLSSLLINLFFLYILVDIFQFPKFIGQICVTGFNVIYNFLLNKYWTFNK